MIISQVGVSEVPFRKSGEFFRWGLIFFNPEDDEMIVDVGGLNIPNFGNRYRWVLLGG